MLSRLKPTTFYRGLMSQRPISYTSYILNNEDGSGNSKRPSKFDVNALIGDSKSNETPDDLLQNLMKNIKSKSKTQVKKKGKFKKMEVLSNVNHEKGKEFWFKNENNQKNLTEIHNSENVIEEVTEMPIENKVLPVHEVATLQESKAPVKDPLVIEKLKENIEEQSDNRNVSKLMSALIEDIDDQSSNAEDKLKALMGAMNLKGNFQETREDEASKPGDRLRENRRYSRKKVSLTKGQSTNLFQGFNFVTKEKENIPMSLSELEWQVDLNNLLPEQIPQNSFEEIMLTLDKQWNFPIDNEQDMGVEEDTSFEEHVFLDHYLEEFPEEGAIRKFMELVITGLQQNPYLTVAEKEKRIFWFKEYFENFQSSDLVL